MKKALLLLLCVSAISATAQKRKFGIIAGISNPALTEGVGNAVDFQYSPVPQFGVFYEIDLTKNTHFRPRLMYSLQGKRNQEAYYPGLGSAYKLDYLNASLDMKFWNKVYLIVGPQIGVLVGEQRVSSFSGPAKSSIDLGANLGLGIRFNENFFMEIGGYQGFTPVLERKTTGYTYNGTTQYCNLVARISLGWRIL